MKNSKKNHGFTLLELMVAIAVSTIVVSVFFKMYETASRVERTTFRRSSAYLIGDKMVNAVADSMRMIGFNKSKFDPITDGAVEGGYLGGGKTSVAFKSPYGTVISKLAEAASGSGTSCTLKLISEQMGAYDSTMNSNRIYAHTKAGLRTGTISGISGNQLAASFSDISDCSELPAGTIVGGADMCFHLNVNTTAGSSLFNFFATPMADGDTCSANGSDTQAQSTDILFLDYRETGQGIALPIKIKKFIIEYLWEDRSDDTNIVREWTTTSLNTSNSEKSIVAVRFGIIVADPMPRYSKSEQITGEKIKYCIFPSSAETDYCYENTNMNESVYVFRRTVYLRNEDYLRGIY